MNCKLELPDIATFLRRAHVGHCDRLIQNVNIARILTEQAAIRPDAPAIIEKCGGTQQTTTFRELEEASGRTAALLASTGLKAGDRALVLQPMSSELYIALTALFRLGMTAVFLDPSAGPAHISRCCEIARPRALIGSAKAQLLFVIPAIRRIASKIVIGPALPGSIPWSRSETMAPMEWFHPCDETSPALITFTSGSTGRPKAALRTHGFLLAQHRALERTIGLNPGEIDLATLPIFALANLAAGVASIIPDVDLRSPGTADPARLLAQIDSCRPTRITASPALLERLVDRSILDGRELPMVREVFTGGAPVLPRLLDKVRAVAHSARITAVYGSTEAEPIAEIEIDDFTPEDRRAIQSGAGLLAGMPVPMIQLRIIRDQWGEPICDCTDAEFDTQPLPVNARGEIVVSGDHVLTGYLDGEGDSETKFRVGGSVWHRTGDSGYLDAQDRLWLLGRCSAIVTDSKGVLYPFAVECAAQHFQNVRRAALVSRSGERVVAVEAELQARIDGERLRAALSWAYIDRIAVVRRIPVDRRHNAKVDYTALDRIIS